LEGTQLGQLTPTDQREIPHHVVSCSAIQLDGGVGRLAMAAIAWGLAGHQLAGGEQLSGGFLHDLVFIFFSFSPLLLFKIFF